jgi:alanine racemase
MPRYAHLSSTIAVAYKRTQAWGNLVRPGHSIYGYVSPARGAEAPKSALKVAPALTWKVTVLNIKEVEAGALIGYGGIHRAARPMRIAVLAAGYADGIPHRLGNRGQVIAKGKLAPIIGAVSMDLTTVDVIGIPSLRAGDSVMLLGKEGNVSIDAQQMARTAGTISYAVLCGIHARVKRVYVD